MTQTRIVLNRNQGAWKDGELRGPAAAPDPGNQDAILALLEYRALTFNGRSYMVPPITYKDGLRLQQLQRKREQLDGKPADDATLAKYGELVAEIVAVCGPLLRPIGWRKRVPWRRNPLRAATEPELGAVLDFLVRCRMAGRVRLQLTPDPRHGLI